MRAGNLIATTSFTTTTSAPSGATDGASCVLVAVGGDNHNADEITIAAAFDGGSTPYVDVVPWLYIGTTWYPGATVMLQDAPDYDNGCLANVPGVGSASRIALQCVTYSGAATSVAVSAYHNEHKEAL